MREPKFTRDDVPFSKAEASRLKRVVLGISRAQPLEEDGSCDADFRRRYAAILLKERGLC